MRSRTCCPRPLGWPHHTGPPDAASDVAEQAAILRWAVAGAASAGGLLLTVAGCWSGDPFLLQHAATIGTGMPGGRCFGPRRSRPPLSGLLLGGSADSARSAFTRADELYDRLGANWDLAHLRAQLRQPRYPAWAEGPSIGRRRPGGTVSPLPRRRLPGWLPKACPTGRSLSELVLSPRTVGTHVSHILAKLGVRSRIDIARESAEHDLVSG